MDSSKRKHRNYLTSTHIFSCNSCHCHLIDQKSIISRNFQGRNGPAYLVDSVSNVTIGAKEERMLLTGIHTVADIVCNQCHVKIGWKYLRALEEPQKYKEGKYIVEKSRVSKDFEWD
ncbi:peptidylprolyl isomerase [Mucor circinelloides 1006PhL]|uniref:Protein yippee-like n=1 Tax=Mucor circinelloides f. circinelloides (strain 1006PhL) TaxID=1220926 RepID=S2JGC1_MUCC1|nr:peptidylprolyl isomerase [Mucor circinelloides 1006PhL]